MSVRVVTAPTYYPVTVAEAKDWCRITSTGTSQDAMLEMLIAAATGYAEHITGRAFVERTLELRLPCFTRCIELPHAPLIAIDSVKYIDIDNAERTVSDADYEVDTTSEPGRVRPLSAKSWPSVGTLFYPVRVTYRAGYAPVGSPADPDDRDYFPGPLRLWMQARICTLYDNRDHLFIGNGGVVELPRAFVDGLLDPLILGTRLF